MDPATLVRTDGPVTETLELGGDNEPRIGSLWRDADHGGVGSSYVTPCDASLESFRSNDDCDAAIAAGAPASDLRPCLGRVAPFDDVTFHAFEQVLAHGGSMWTLTDAGACERWRVTPSGIEHGEHLGRFELERAGVHIEWHYRHVPGRGSIVFGAHFERDANDPDGGATSFATGSRANDEVGQTIGTPAPGVIDLKRRFVLDPTACLRTR